MKTTIKITTTQEVEVSLPQFRKDGNEYYAFYSENYLDNIYFRVYKGRLMTFMAFCELHNINKGNQITESEFIKAFNSVKNTIDLVGVSPSITNDEQGEYYLTDAEKEDLGSTAGEQTDDLGFQEFENTTL
jgi:hypothetical protein